MSVLIKDMVMPETCENCPFNYDEMSCIITGTRWWVLLEDFDYTKERLHDCPLSEVSSAQPEITNEEIRFSLKQLGVYLAIKIRDGKDGSVPVELLKRVEEIQKYFENVPSAQPDSKETSSTQKPLDTISRQAAIDVAIDAADDWDGGYNLSRADMIEKAINNLPSAHPTYTDAEIQKMQDLESAEIEKAYQLGYEEGKKDAHPKWKTGEWITNLYAFGEDRYECDQCHNTALHLYDFCPNCGADMRGEQNDEQ